MLLGHSVIINWQKLRSNWKTVGGFDLRKPACCHKRRKCTNPKQLNRILHLPSISAILLLATLFFGSQRDNRMVLSKLVIFARKYTLRYKYRSGRKLGVGDSTTLWRLSPVPSRRTLQGHWGKQSMQSGQIRAITPQSRFRWVGTLAGEPQSKSPPQLPIYRIIINFKQGELASVAPYVAAA